MLSSLLFFSVPAMSANVVVQKIALESAKQQVQAVGNTEAIHSVVMYPAVGDRVTGVFFKPGDKVKKGQTLILIEAMKTFNPVQAPSDGILKSMHVSDGQPLEFEQLIAVIGN